MQGAHRHKHKVRSRPEALEEGEMRTSVAEQRAQTRTEGRSADATEAARGKRPATDPPADYQARKAEMQHDPRDARINILPAQVRKCKDYRKHDRPGNVVFLKNLENGEVAMTQPLLTVGEPRIGHPPGGPGRPGSRKWPTVVPLLEEGNPCEYHLDSLAPIGEVLPGLCDLHSRTTDDGERENLQRIVYVSVDKQRALERNSGKSPAALCETLAHGRGGELHAIYTAGERQYKPTSD